MRYAVGVFLDEAWNGCLDILTAAQHVRLECSRWRLFRKPSKGSDFPV